MVSAGFGSGGNGGCRSVGSRNFGTENGVIIPLRRCSRFWAVRFWRRRSHCHIYHGRYVTFQVAKVVVSRQMLADVVTLITRLRVAPAPA
jgi:hypothetical protein